MSLNRRQLTPRQKRKLEARLSRHDIPSTVFPGMVSRIIQMRPPLSRHGKLWWHRPIKLTKHVGPLWVTGDALRKPDGERPTALAASSPPPLTGTPR